VEIYSHVYLDDRKDIAYEMNTKICPTLLDQIKKTGITTAGKMFFIQFTKTCITGMNDFLERT